MLFYICLPCLAPFSKLELTKGNATLSKLLSLHKVAAMGREVRDRVRGEVIKGGLVGGGGGSQVVRQPDLSRLSQLCASLSGLTLEYFQKFIRSTQQVGFFNIGLERVLEKVLGSRWG